MSFERVCSLDELDVAAAALAIVGDVRVALVRDVNGHVHAVADECTHGKVSLAEGEVDGCFIECWLHGSRFDMRTGQPKTPPALTPVAVYPVRIDGDDVLVDVAVSRPAPAPSAVSVES